MKNIWKTLTRQKAVFAILALLVIMGGAELFTHTTFYTLYNWLDMLRSAAVLEIVAMGVSVAVLCGGCDLSVGGTLCIGGILAVMTVNAGLPIWLAFAAAMAAGALIGAVNGFLIVHQRTEPFIITLGMGMLLKGIAQQLTDAHPLTCKSLEFMTHLQPEVFRVGALPGGVHAGDRGAVLPADALHQLRAQLLRHRRQLRGGEIFGHRGGAHQVVRLRDQRGDRLPGGGTAGLPDEHRLLGVRG